MNLHCIGMVGQLDPTNRHPQKRTTWHRPRSPSTFQSILKTIKPSCTIRLTRKPRPGKWPTSIVEHTIVKPSRLLYANRLSSRHRLLIGDGVVNRPHSWHTYYTIKNIGTLASRGEYGTITLSGKMSRPRQSNYR